MDEFVAALLVFGVAFMIAWLTRPLWDKSHKKVKK